MNQKKNIFCLPEKIEKQIIDKVRLVARLRPIVFLWDLGLQGEYPPWGAL